MATELVMPAPRGDHRQYWHSVPPNRPHYGRSQSYHTSAGPQLLPLSISDSSSSRTTSMPPSPTGRYSHQTGPMYIPAVLRPCDEFPSRTVLRPNTRGSTSDSDFDSSPRRANSKIMSLAAFGSLSRRRGCRSPSDLSVLEGDWNLESFPEVTALPTRRHWKPDLYSSVCDDPTCKRSFSYFVRRHHCRKCGNIFCDWHSSFVLPLDQDASFNPRAVLSRACNHCFREAKGWQTKLSSPAPTMPGLNAPHAALSTPTSALSTGATPTAPAGAEVAASIPRDWNWSTF